MAEDFKASPPEFNLYWSDENGNIDLKDRDNSTGLWEKIGKNSPYLSGGGKGKRRFMAFPNAKNKDAVREFAEALISWCNTGDDPDW